MKEIIFENFYCVKKEFNFCFLFIVIYEIVIIKSLSQGRHSLHYNLAYFDLKIL